LQTTLLFSPPEPEAAKALLSGIAAAEGENVSDRYLDDLVQACQLKGIDPAIFSKPLLPPPPAERRLLGIDLRSAICQLQLELSYAGKGRPNSLRQTLSIGDAKSAKAQSRKHQDGTDEDSKDMRAVSQMMEIISLADAHIARRPGSVIDVSVARRKSRKMLIGSFSSTTQTGTSRPKTTRRVSTSFSNHSLCSKRKSCQCCREKTRWRRLRQNWRCAGQIKGNGWMGL
jgi:hypothetical protein